jgi:hypothetical protein
MNSIIQENKPEKEIQFPCLMTNSSGLIIMFTSPRCGVTLNTIINIKRGDFRINWDIDNFTPFNGSITLFND